jgi:hypothetical protein
MLWEVVTKAGFNVDDQAEDEIIWMRSPGGTYSSKSAYELQFEGGIISPFLQLFGWFGCRPNENSSFGSSFKTEYGPLIGCSSEDGRTNISTPSTSEASRLSASIHGVPYYAQGVVSYWLLGYFAEVCCVQVCGDNLCRILVLQISRWGPLG